VATGIGRPAQGHATPDVNKSALLVLANVCSDAVVGVDASAYTRIELWRGARFERLLRCLFVDDEVALHYAVGACQNACTNYEAAVAIRDGGVLERLEQLAQCGIPTLEAYSTGCLHNMRYVLKTGEKLNAITDRMQSRAASAVQNATRRWIARRRREKMLSDARRAAGLEG